MLGNLWDVIVSLTIWTIVFAFYVFLGAGFGAWLSRRSKHDSDNLGWILLGMLMFGGVLFPFTYYVFYAG